MTTTPSSKAADPFTGPSKAAELLACPFCHSLDVHISDSGPTWHEQFYGCCNICNARGPTSCAEPDARRLWNTRHIPQAAQDVRERFEAWYSDDNDNSKAIERNANGEYVLMQARSAWIAFQAGAGAASASSPARQMSEGDGLASDVLAACLSDYREEVARGNLKLKQMKEGNLMASLTERTLLKQRTEKCEQRAIDIAEALRRITSAEEGK